MPDLETNYSQGYVDARDRGELRNGECQQATGVWYKPGDPLRAHKLNGRSLFGSTGSGAKVKGVALCQFESGSSKVLALSGSNLYGATPGATGTFSSLGTIESAATKMSSVHANDRWFLGFGADQKNQVLESGGTIRDHGMEAPAFKAEATAISTPGTSINASTNDSATGWDDLASGYSDNSTFARATANGIASLPATFGFASGVTTGTPATHSFRVTWALAGIPPRDVPWDGGFSDTGATADSGFNVTVIFDYSEDGGTSYQEWFRSTYTSFRQIVTSTREMTDSIASENLKFRATLIYNSGSSPATLRIYAVELREGASTSATFTTSTGIYYAVAEYDQNTIRISPATEPSELVELSGDSGVSIPIPATARNSATTHWYVYRTADQGTAPQQLGQVGIVDLGDTVFIDSFDDYGIAEQPDRPYPLLEVGSTPYPRDTPPPSVSFLGLYKGSMFGLSGRSLYYSIPGRYESWPEIYVIEAIPLPEQDSLVAAYEVGGSLVVGAEAAMLRVDELPRVSAGNFTAGRTEQITGAPGVVGQYAMCPVSVSGEDHVAWISHYGVYITNGHQYSPISRDMDFTQFDGTDKSDWVLHYDKLRRALVMSFADGTYYLIFVESEHRKQSGQGKITGPHYGNITDLASGQVSNTHRLYSAHGTDGKVYVEDDRTTGLDASNAYANGGVNPLIVKGPRRYADGMEYTVYEGSVGHTDFGIGEELTVLWETGRESNNGTTFVKTKTVSLSGHGRSHFDLVKSGEWHEEVIQHLGEGRGAISDLRVRLSRAGLAGERGVA